MHYVHEGSHDARHALRSETSFMFVSRVLRQPARTLHVRLYASKSTSPALKAVPERTTTVTGSPPTGGEQKRAYGPGPLPNEKKTRSSQPRSERRRAVLLLCPEYHPRRTELPQGPAPRRRSSRRGVSALVVEIARQVRVAG